MRQNVYTVYDKVAEECGPLFTAVNDGVAIRQFKTLGIPESLKNDYELRCVGAFETTDGQLELLDSYQVTEKFEELENGKDI